MHIVPLLQPLWRLMGLPMLEIQRTVRRTPQAKAACKAMRAIDPHYCEFVVDRKQTISIFLSYPYVLCNILTFLVPFTILIVSDHATDPLESNFM